MSGRAQSNRRYLILQHYSAVLRQLSVIILPSTLLDMCRKWRRSLTTLISKPNIKMIYKPNIKIISRTNFKMISLANIKMISVTNIRLISIPNIKLISKPNIKMVSKPKIKMISSGSNNIINNWLIDWLKCNARLIFGNTWF